MPGYHGNGTKTSIQCMQAARETMAAKVESRSVVSTKRLEGSLVAPRTSDPVPNHLTATSESGIRACQV